MNDDDFLRSLEDCTLPPQYFNHAGHVRLAWIQLRRLPFGQAVERTCSLIRLYAAHLGAAGKFHYTITAALMHLLRAAGACEPGLERDAFMVRAAPLLADARGRLARHYSDELLASGAAREAFIAPDRLPLP
jgi:hypothetical protein